MKAVMTFVLIGIGAITCAVVSAQTQGDKPKTAVGQPPSAGVRPYIIRDGHSELAVTFDPSLQDQSIQLVNEYHNAKEEDKKEIRKKLADVLGKQFDAHMEQQQKELADLEKQIADLRALLKKRQEAKSAIVDRRIEQLIQDAEGLGWTAPGGQHQPWYYRRPALIDLLPAQPKSELPKSRAEAVK